MSFHSEKQKESVAAPEVRPGTPGVRLGIALSGGGARGFAHAGALAAIEEAGLRPDVIAGVSAGSIVAALYSAGVRPQDFVNLFHQHGFMDFVNLRPGGSGLFSLEPFRKFLLQNLGQYKNLEDLPIPVFIGATDFESGVPVAFDHGPIAERVLASSCIPIVFKPVVIDGVQYVDGGVLRNHPAWIIRDKCDYLIGINVSPLSRKAKYTSLVDTALHTYHLMAKANQAVDMRLCDLNVATTELAHYRSFDLRYINNVYLSGYIHTRKALRDAGLWHRTTPPTL